jgi:hypothetical protein
MAEHVFLESDDAEEAGVPEFHRARKVQAQASLRSSVRGGRLALNVFDYRYLSVRTKRRWAAPEEFVLELRFIDPRPACQRNVPKRCWWVTAGLAGLCALAAWIFSVTSLQWWQQPWLAILASLGGVTIVFILVSTYLTTETVAFHSLSGRAKVLEFVGGLGTFRSFRAFQAKLSAHIRHAVAACKRTKAQHLRDEMREHQRLRELGILSAADYEDSKSRILRMHE